MNPCKAVQKKQSGRMSGRIKRKILIPAAAALFLLLVGSILYILYRTHPFVTINDALRKTAESGCFSFILRNGEETLTGTAQVDLKEKRIDMAAEGRERTVYLYQNTLFSVEQGSGAVSGYRDISDVIAFFIEILEGKLDADTFIIKLRGRLVLGSAVDYFFDDSRLAQSLEEYLRKFIKTEYLEKYFGFQKRKENKNIIYSFTPKLYEAAADFMETIRPAFWDEDKYTLFREKLIAENSAWLQTAETGFDITIHNGYIIKVRIRTGGSAAEVTFGDFGNAEKRFEAAAPYFRKEKERRGWT